MLTVPQALGLAVQHHQSGQLRQAEQLYRDILQRDPHQVDALHLLGLVSYQVGQHARAIEYMSQALRLRPDFAAIHNNLGIVLKEQGQLIEAAASYQQALRCRPDYAEAHNNLGNVRQQQGQLAEAAASYEQALRYRPNYAEAYTNLGNVHRQQGQLREAEACYQQALHFRPDFAGAHASLGRVFQEQGQLAEAAASYQQALRWQPDDAETHAHLGKALQEQGKLAEAEASYRQALRCQPDLVGVSNQLGNLLQRQGQWAKAAACYEQALRWQPDYVEAHNNLGIVLQKQGQLTQAMACYEQAVRLQPERAETHHNLGTVLHEQRQLEAAAASLRRALGLKPDYAEAYNSLGLVLQEQGKLAEAHACLQQALRRQPDYVEAHTSLGNVLYGMGQLDEAIACYQHALHLKPDDADLHSNLLFVQHYRADVTLPQLAQAHAEYERRHTARLRSTWQPHTNDRDPHRPLRLGFVSPDLGRHPVGYYLLRVLENLDREQCAVVCYSNRTLQDDMTARFQATASAWRDVVGWSDDRLAEQIRADRIDLLFDLAGFTAKNRLGVFARKPAPLQITWIGYEGTTGLSAMDYILADPYLIPPQAEVHYGERVLRLPDGYICYDPPREAPPVAALPAWERGHVTLGSFNRPAKITDMVVAVWARILQRLPQARLVVKYKGLDDPPVARRLAERFAGHGIAPSRVECRGSSPHEAMLAQYHDLDLALDPFPFNGGVTTCEALWMGVPVITCPGETFASRHSLTHLSNIGLPELIARNLEEYVELAVSWAEDLPRLAALRARLRAQMAAAPLCDGPRFAANLMRLLRAIWQQWLAQDA